MTNTHGSATRRPQARRGGIICLLGLALAAIPANSSALGDPGPVTGPVDSLKNTTPRNRYKVANATPRDRDDGTKTTSRKGDKVKNATPRNGGNVPKPTSEAGENVKETTNSTTTTPPRAKSSPRRGSGGSTSDRSGSDDPGGSTSDRSERSGSVVVVGGVTVGPAGSFSPGSVASDVFRSSGPPPPATAPGFLLPFPMVVIDGRFGRRGIVIDRLIVRAPRGATLSAGCRGRRCPPRVKRARLTVAGGGPGLRLRRFERAYGHGARVELRIVQGQEIRKFVSLRVGRAQPPVRNDLCVQAGGKPFACPAG